MMQIKFNFDNFIFYGVSATAWQRASGIAVVAGGCDWPIQWWRHFVTFLTFLTLRALRWMETPLYSYVVGESVDIWTSNEDGLSSQSNGFEDVRSCSYSAVQVDFASTGHCLHHFRQHVYLKQEHHSEYSLFCSIQDLSHDILTSQIVYVSYRNTLPTETHHNHIQLSGHSCLCRRTKLCVDCWGLSVCLFVACQPDYSKYSGRMPITAKNYLVFIEPCPTPPKKFHQSPFTSFRVRSTWHAKYKRTELKHDLLVAETVSAR